MKGSPPSRVLVCGPMYPDQGIGGLQAALTDLAHGLQARSWDVDTIVVPAFAAGATPDWRTRLASFSRRAHVPEPWRFLSRVVLSDLRRLRQASELFDTIERHMRDGDYDAVIACVDNAPVGLTALLTRIHPRVIFISLTALASELRDRRALDIVRRIVRTVASGPLHPDLVNPADPARITTTVFANETWRGAGLAAGLDPASTSVIHFGVRTPLALPPLHSVQAPVRLLWAARLGPEKGLHLFLPALARLRQRLAFRLTVVEAGGSAAYRRSILRMVERHRLGDSIDFRPAVARDDLPGIMASHDVFLFHSVYAEPVAQMLLLAFGTGLTVVGPDTRNPRSLLRPGETAFCFDDATPASIADAIERASRDETSRRRLRARAFALVTAEHQLKHTMDDYDRLLTGMCMDRPAAARA